MKRKLIFFLSFLIVFSGCLGDYFLARPEIELAERIERKTSYQVFHVEVYEEKKAVSLYVMAGELEVPEGTTPEEELARRRAANQFFFETTWKESVNAGYEIVQVWIGLPQKVLTIDGEVGVSVRLIFVVTVKKEEIIAYFETEERGYFEYHVPFVKRHMVLLPSPKFGKDANHWKKSDIRKLAF